MQLKEITPRQTLFILANINEISIINTLENAAYEASIITSEFDRPSSVVTRKGVITATYPYVKFTNNVSKTIHNSALFFRIKEIHNIYKTYSYKNT